MRQFLIPAAVLVVGLSLAGCTAGSSSDSSSQSGASKPAPLTAQDYGEIGNTDSDSTAVADGSAKTADRQIVTTGSMTVTAKDPHAAAADAARIAEAAGGRVDARTEQAPSKGDNGSATITLRVPSNVLSATVDKLGALGKVEEVQQSSSDVTAESQDLDSRTSALRASVTRLTALLSTATDTKVLIDLETAITERQGSLETMEAQQRSLADQVSLSTLDVWLVSKYVPVVATAKSATFWSGLVGSWGVFVGFLGFLLVAVGALLPWAASAGVIALIVRWLVRRGRAKIVAPSVTFPPPTPESAL